MGVLMYVENKTERKKFCQVNKSFLHQETKKVSVKFHRFIVIILDFFIQKSIQNAYSAYQSKCSGRLYNERFSRLNFRMFRFNFFLGLFNPCQDQYSQSRCQTCP